MPQTSSDASPPDAASPKSRAIEHPPSTVAHNTQAVVEFHPAPTHDVAPHFAVKGAAIVVGSLIELWLLVDAMDGFLTFSLVASILWFVYGEYQKFVADNLAPPVPIPVSDGEPAPEDPAVNVKSWRGKVLSDSPVASSHWCNVTTELTAPRYLDHVEDEQIKATLKERFDTFCIELEGDGIFLELCRLMAVYECVDAQEAFLELCRMMLVFEHSEDYVEIYACLNELTAMVLNEQDLVKTIKVNMAMGTNGVVKEVTIRYVSLEKEQQCVERLENEHEQPEFKDEYLDAWYKKVNEVHNGILDFDPNTNEFSKHVPDWDHFSLARSVGADEKDMKFMEEQLGDQAPEQYYDAIALLPDGVQKHQTRFAENGYNPIMDSLSLKWREIHGMPVREKQVPVKTLKDIHETEVERIRSHRQECPTVTRHCFSPDLSDEHRPYLTEKEEMNVNLGCSEYSVCYPDGELGKVQERLRAENPNHTQLNYDGATIPKWLWNVKDGEVLDPNAFESCPCEKIAAQQLSSYRAEKEHGYWTMRPGCQVFPIEFLSMDQGLEEYDGRKKGSKDGIWYEQPLPRRCQQVIQDCRYHAMVTDFIFVLLDDAIYDPNARITNPGGLLPAPGLQENVVYPSGFEVPRGIRDIPYENLPPRCRHGNEHPGVNQGCELCFPRVQRILWNGNMVYREIQGPSPYYLQQRRPALPAPVPQPNVIQDKPTGIRGLGTSGARARIPFVLDTQRSFTSCILDIYDYAISQDMVGSRYSSPRNDRRIGSLQSAAHTRAEQLRCGRYPEQRLRFLRPSAARSRCHV
jgi:hypothetical protein